MKKLGNQNRESKPQPSAGGGFRNFAFCILRFAFPHERAGVTLLLVVLVLSALLSVSLGIIDVVIGEFRISGEIADSFTALYAADEGTEKILYDDRVGASLCPRSDTCAYGPVTTTLENGACYTLRLTRGGGNTVVVSTGEYRCGSPALSVKRAFEATYTRSATSTPPPSLPRAILDDTFGIGASVNDIPNWDEEGDDSRSSTLAQAPGSGDNSASPDGERFALIGRDEWICRQVSAVGFNTLVLSYYWRGDSDAEDGEAGMVEHRIGGSCESSSGWTNAAPHELDAGNANASAWSSLQSLNLPASLNGTSFFLRFRNGANSGNEHFRIDAVRITGVPN